MAILQKVVIVEDQKGQLCWVNREEIGVYGKVT